MVTGFRKSVDNLSQKMTDFSEGLQKYEADTPLPARGARNMIFEFCFLVSLHLSIELDFVKAT